MNSVIKTFFVLSVFFCSLAFTQEKQRVAVYMAGTEPKGAQGSHKMVAGELVKEISRSRNYSAVDRTDAILAQLAKEHGYQRSGAVNDAQIKALGKQFGVSFLCIVEISDVKGGFYLSLRLVDVETAEVVKSATADSDLKDRSEMMRISQQLALELVGGGSSAQAPPPSSSQQARPAAQQTASPQPASGANAFTDSRDGKRYRTVRIGNKTWMAENLNFQTGNSWCYDNNSSNCGKYGRLYDWNTAMNACPSGWRLPNDNDWTALTTAGGINAGRNLKSKSGWIYNGNGTDQIGFSALPGGHRNPGGSFFSVGNLGLWWSATEDDASRARSRNMLYRSSSVNSNWDYKGSGFSVRCLQD